MFVSVKTTLKKIETLQTNTVIMLIKLFKTFYTTLMNIKKIHVVYDYEYNWFFINHHNKTNHVFSILIVSSKKFFYRDTLMDRVRLIKFKKEY